MGVEHQPLTAQVTSTSVRENSVKRAKAVPTVGIYRPPALRRSEEQITTPESGRFPSFPTASEVKPERTRPARQRRPDIQVYVPRAKRLIGEKERCASASQQLNRVKGWNSLTNKVDKSKTLYEGSSKVGAPSDRSLQSTSHVYTKSKEVSVGSGVRRKDSGNSSYENLPAESDNVLKSKKLTTEFSNSESGAKTTSHLERRCDEGRNSESNDDVAMLDAFNVSKSMENTENFLEDANFRHRFTCKDSNSSSGMSTPSNSGRNTPFSPTDNGGQIWDYFSEIKNATNNPCNKTNCKMDDRNISSVDKVDSTSISEPINYTVHHEKSDLKSLVKDCNIDDQVLDSSGITGEDIIECDNREDNTALTDITLSSSSDNERYKSQLEVKVDSKGISNDDYGHKKDEDDDCRVQEVQNRKNRRIIRPNFVSDVLIISDQGPVPPLLSENDASVEKTYPLNGVLTKKKKVKHKADSSSSKVHSPEKQMSSSNPVNVTLNPDECTWDMMFDDNGECLDPTLMEELTNAVGSVTIEKPQSDYRSYQSRLQMMLSGDDDDDEFSHVLEIYNFPPEFKTQDLITVFSPYMRGGFEIKWVDDTHALGVFSSSTVAAEVLATDHPFIKTRPLQEATHESKMKARRSAEFLQPYRPRPETCAALARRLVTGALGVKLNTSREEREAERKILREAREKKRLAARQRDEAWEGTIGEK